MSATSFRYSLLLRAKVPALVTAAAVAHVNRLPVLLISGVSLRRFRAKVRSKHPTSQ